MQCRRCGTEIADKAIICYRCGTATTDPVRRPAAIQPRQRPMLTLVVIAALVALALVLARMSRTAADPEILQVLAGISGGAALVLLLLRIFRRR